MRLKYEPASEPVYGLGFEIYGLGFKEEDLAGHDSVHNLQQSLKYS